MDREENISQIISDSEAIKVISDDIADHADIEDQHRVQAIRTMADDILRIARNSY